MRPRRRLVPVQEIGKQQHGRAFGVACAAASAPHHRLPNTMRSHRTKAPAAEPIAAPISVQVNGAPYRLPLSAPEVWLSKYSSTHLRVRCAGLASPRLRDFQIGFAHHG